MTVRPVHARFDGPVVMLGFGSIGRGGLPLILRHVALDRDRLVVIAADDSDREIAEQYRVRFERCALTPANYREVLRPRLGGGLLVNLTVDVCSASLIALCREAGALYVDTSIESWPDGAAGVTGSVVQRSTYALREGVLALRRPGEEDPTAVVAHGANPGLVNHLVKVALLQLAADLGGDATPPGDRAGWARLARDLGVKGIHVSERDTQVSDRYRQPGEFVNTWSVDGLVDEGMLPAELGFGTHEKGLPPEGARYDFGCGAAIYLRRPGASTRVRSWTPGAGAIHGYLMPHNEAISIADYFTLGRNGTVSYRPTCHYAYHPCDDAVLSLRELQARAFRPQKRQRLLNEEIVAGANELGVLLYGHARNAYWYGSLLTIEEARRLVPHQNATGLQVSAALLAGVVWAIENPRRGIVEAEQMDHARVLDIMRPYLGTLAGAYTDWTPLAGRPGLFPEDLDPEDPWQFRNVIVR